MALENKKLNRKNDLLINQTKKDQQDSNSNDTLTRLIATGLVIAGGTALYKSGALKGVTHKLKEFGAVFADKSSTGYLSTRAIKNWANGQTGELVRPDRSLFNANKSASLGYDLWQDLRESFARGEFYNTNTRRIISDTISDIDILSSMIEKETRGISRRQINNIKESVLKELDGQSQENIEKEIAKRIEEQTAKGLEKIRLRNASVKNSSLIKNMRQIDDIFLDLKMNAGIDKASSQINVDIINKFVLKNTLTPEEAAEQIRVSGFKSLTLGDIFEGYDAREHKLIFKEGLDADVLFKKYKINLNEQMGGNQSVLDQINSFLSNSQYKYSPGEGQMPYVIGNFKNVWENIVIDDRLNIDQNGKIINYMMSQDALKFFGNSLRKDFGLPMLGFNPIDSAIKVIPSLDKRLNDRTIQFGIQNGIGGFNPWITGHGTRLGDDISTTLQKRFNKPDETFHLLFNSGDVYAIGSGGSYEFLGSGFNAYNIRGADKAFKMPHKVEMMRIMGGYDLNQDPMKEVLEELGTNRKLFSPNLTIEEYEKLNNIKMTTSQKLKYEIGRHLDLGFQEYRAHYDNEYFNMTEAANIDNLFDEVIDKVMHSNTFRTNGFEFENYQEAASVIRNKTYEMAFGNSFEDYITRSGAKVKAKNIVITKQGISFRDLIKDAKAGEHAKFTEDFKGMFQQYFVGFDRNYNTHKFFNEKSSSLYDVFNMLDRGFSTIGLGLSLESKRSTGALVSNLLLKRALPVYMLTQIPGMLNYFSEPFFTNSEEKEEGKTDTLGKTLMRNVVKPIDIGAHKIGDTLGFTKIFKYLQEMTPGSEHINELPGIYHLGLGQTAEERKEYIEKGYDPIRKNRYWSVSNTPFTGSKIDHWRPNIYRRIEADTKFSDTMYGSRQEYYNNTWYPNLINPFAPINHFLLDPNHWDKKHYYDRPYAETAPKGENIPLIGPLVSGTIGQIYRHKMHEEYWNKDGTLKPVNPEDEKPSALLSTGISSFNTKSKNGIIQMLEKAFVDTETFNKVNTKAKDEYVKAAKRSFIDNLFAKKVVESNELPQSGTTFTQYKKTPFYDNALKSYSVAYNPTEGDANVVENKPYLDTETFKKKLFTKAKEYYSPLQSSTLPYRDYDRYGTALDVYTTPSGSTQVVDVPENLNLYKVNEEIKHYSLNKIYGTNQRVNIGEYDRGYQAPEVKETSNELLYNIGEEFNDIGNIYGLKGFLLQTMFTGEANVGSTKVENSSYAYSANRSFWDQNLGGLGGELSEISRRFIHKKDKDVEYLNPIRNTMPTWMPGSNYFTDYLHGDPYSKIMNGEERLPGEAYERLNNIDFSFNISASMLSNSRAAHVKHFLHQDTNLTYEQEQYIKGLKSDTRPKEITEDKYEIQDLNRLEDGISRILDHFKRSEVLLDSNMKFNDATYDITGVVDARIKNYHSRTGESLINIRGVDEQEFKRLRSGHDIRKQDYYEMNFDAYALNNTKGRNYVYYYNKQNPDDIYKAQIKFSSKDLRSSIQNLQDAKSDIYAGLKTGEISRGDLYSLVEKYKILADTAPYSQEFKDISAQISHAHLSTQEREEVKAARERMKEQKNPLRVYDYKFKTANLQSEKVTVKKVIDNNTIIVNEYGREHAIKFAGIRVSESNTNLYGPSVKEKTERNKATGRERTIRKGLTMNEAANAEIKKYLEPGKTITIQYDADERNKYSKDSTQSIKAIVQAKGVNLNRRLLNKGLATEKETDDSPAGIHARYSKGDIAFGSMMERLTHGAAKLPFIGDKFFQIRSPYEQYRKREVYNKDFKTWNHPIKDFLIPTAQDISSQHPVAAVVGGAFLGRLFGKNAYGKMVGTLIGGGIGLTGAIVHHIGSDEEHEWRPRRRRQQEELNTYIDTLKYIKNTKLYNQYKELAKKHDKFDVDAYLAENQEQGAQNKERAKELNNYKRLVKLDFKHRNNYNFKYGEPKYVQEDQSKKEVIKAINQELAEISNTRKVEKLPLNAIKAIAYKQEAERTMYAYEPGDDVRNIMSALPKKERQYYSKLVKAPEEEKQKILRIAPSYLRRALQASWGMKVDEKPTLTEYFKNHALPGESWEGWQEETDLEDVKVKIVNDNGLDPGEYDIWTDNKKKADQVNIPIPRINTRNKNEQLVQAQLSRLLGDAGLDNVRITQSTSISGNQVGFNINEDDSYEVSEQIKKIEI